MMPATFSQRLSRPSLQARQIPQVRAPYITTVLSGPEARDHVADPGDFTGGLGTDHQRQLALRKRHAAIAPDVDVIERDGLDADLHFAGARRRRRRNCGDHELTIGNESERAHDAVSACSPPRG